MVLPIFCVFRRGLYFVMSKEIIKYIHISMRLMLFFR